MTSHRCLFFIFILISSNINLVVSLNGTFSTEAINPKEISTSISRAEATTTHTLSSKSSNEDGLDNDNKFSRTESQDQDYVPVIIEYAGDKDTAKVNPEETDENTEEDQVSEDRVKSGESGSSSCNTISQFESPILLTRSAMQDFSPELSSKKNNAESTTKVVQENITLRMNSFYKKRRDRFYIHNNGQNFQFQFRRNAKVSEMLFKCSTCDNDYILAFGTCHWGSDNSVGSEHSLDGHKFPMELQLTHYKRNLKDFETATKVNEGILIVSIFYEIGDEINTALEPLIRAIHDGNPHSSIQQVHGPIKLSSLLPTELNYFEYQGSFTIPPCAGNIVKWIVFATPETIALEQLEQFRKLKLSSGQNMVNNFRPIQALNQRKVSYFVNVAMEVEEDDYFSVISESRKMSLIEFLDCICICILFLYEILIK